MPDWGLSTDGQLLDTVGELNTGATSAIQTTTAGAAGTYSPWVELTSATQGGTSVPITRQINGFWYNSGTNGTLLSRMAVDLGISPDASSTVQPIIQKLFLLRVGGIEHGGEGPYIPLTLPGSTPAVANGTRIWARHVSSGASGSIMKHRIMLNHSGFRAPQAYSLCTTYNMTGTVATGTPADGFVPAAAASCNPGAVAGTNSAYSIISTVASPSTTTLLYATRMVAFTIAPIVTATVPYTGGRYEMDIAIGTGTPPDSQIIFRALAFTMHYVVTTSPANRFAQPFIGPFACQIPAGETVQARVRSTITDATDRPVGIIMYAFS